VYTCIIYAKENMKSMLELFLSLRLGDEYDILMNLIYGQMQRHHVINRVII